MELWRQLSARRDDYRRHALVTLAMEPGELVKTLQTLVRARLARAAAGA
jgi:hypothetical protein